MTLLEIETLEPELVPNPEWDMILSFTRWAKEQGIPVNEKNDNLGHYAVIQAMGHEMTAEI